MRDDQAAHEFINILSAAMADAAKTGHITQLQAVVTPPGGTQKMVRIVVLPEDMDMVRGAPTEKFRSPA